MTEQATFGNETEPNNKSREEMPVNDVQWVDINQLEANDYNPNNVADPEMELLAKSILEDGWTQPIVCYEDGESEGYEIVDGFHRYKVAMTNLQVRSMTDGKVPIAVIDKPIEERMASTVRHNRARGEHEVKPMAEIVAEMADEAEWDDDRIAEELGMEDDEVLRMKQRKGLPELFEDNDFTDAWE